MERRRRTKYGSSKSKWMNSRLSEEEPIRESSLLFSGHFSCSLIPIPVLLLLSFFFLSLKFSLSNQFMDWMSVGFLSITASLFFASIQSNAVNVLESLLLSHFITLRNPEHEHKITRMSPAASVHFCRQNIETGWEKKRDSAKREKWSF